MVDNKEKSPNGPGNDPDTRTACTTCNYNMFRLNTVNVWRLSEGNEDTVVSRRYPKSLFYVGQQRRIAQ